MTINNGEILVFTNDLPVIGVRRVLSVEINSTAVKSLFYFRYSTDNGISFCDWKQLFNENVRSVVIRKTNFLCIEYKVEAKENFTLEDISLLLDYEKPLIPEKFKEMSMSKYVSFWNQTSISWTLNVLKKIVNKGVVSNYINRSEDFNDFFWSAIYLQSLRLSHNQVFSDIFHYTDLARKFAEAKGLFFSTNPNIDEIYKSLKYFYDEMSRRGSLDCFWFRGDFRGEVLRLIDWNEFDEHLLGLINIEESGWLLGFSSPEYEVNPGYENFKKKVSSWSNIVSATSSFEAGVNVDVNLSYRIGLTLKTSSDIARNISFGINLYNNNKAVVKTHSFLNNVAVRVLGNNTLYIEGIVYGLNKSGVDNITSLGVGTNTFMVANVCRICPFFTSNTTVESVEMTVSLLDYDYPVFLESLRSLSLYLKNNNQDISKAKLENILKQYFIPITTELNLNLL